LLYVCEKAATVLEFADASFLPNVEADVQRVVCISDTHEQHHSVQVPPASLLIHCGDAFVNNRKQRNTQKQDYKKLTEFASWLASLPISGEKVIIGGNHDRALEALGKDKVSSVFRKHDERIHYLEDEECPAGTTGFKIWGSPLSEGGTNQAFQTSLEERLGKIPRGGVDILMTHGPVKDAVIKDLHPRVHVCGHIHHHYGVRSVGGTICINASILDGHHQPSHGVFVLDLLISRKGTHGCETYKV